MARDWPETPDDPVDPALAPLLASGNGESEEFDLATAELEEPLLQDASGFDDLLDDSFDYDDYAEADEEPDW